MSQRTSAPPRPSRLLAPTIFVTVGALLLFGLEPMFGRMLLPRFGGAFHVWTTSLMFFQGALFVGYAYAHLAAARLGAGHLALLALPLFFLPPSAEPVTGALDLLDLLAILAARIGLVFAALSTTAVVAQRWVAAAGHDPYPLYAWSNGGSLIALLAYVFLVEPHVGLEAQRWTWTALYAGYLAAAAAAFWTTARRPAVLAAAPERGGELEVSTRSVAYWALIAAAPSAFLMAVTNVIALDAGSVPLVWVIPLAIYLASFVWAFGPAPAGEPSRVPGAVRRLWPHFAAVGLYFFSGAEAGGFLDALVHCAVLAFVCLAAHGELYRARPPARGLTAFYLAIALGGWIGGAFVALVAPALFPGLWEYPFALVTLALVMAAGRRAALGEYLRRAPKAALVVSAALVLVIVGKIGWAHLDALDATAPLEVRRSPYGVYRVVRTARREDAIRDLISGTTRHGRQREGDLEPLSYYHREGPLGDVIALTRAPRSIAAIGLGVGAIAAHLEAGDRLRIFEIDPVVVEFAHRHFGFLDGTRGDVEVMVGDGRVALEARRRRYDLVVVDAFSGDAIPTHLLTREAIALVMTRLRPGGRALLHVSNRVYDLAPVVAAVARAEGLAAASIAHARGLARDEDASEWAVLASDEEALAPLLARGWRVLDDDRGRAAWTDDRVDTLRALLDRALE